MKCGCAYSKGAPLGPNWFAHKTSDGLEHTYAFAPGNHDPSRLSVRVQCTAASRESTDAERWASIGFWQRRSNMSPGRVGRASGGVAARSNTVGILDRLKRTYNVDENRIHLTGISDGGTGTYFMAFRETTPWASFLPLNGDMGVLADASVTTDGDMHPANAVNKPFFIVNGGRDRLYPAAIVEPDINYLKKLGVQVAYHPQPEAGHDTSWWPTEKSNFEAFVREHPRNPLPDRLSWTTEIVERYNRDHWLVIDKLGSAEGETAFPEAAYLFPERRPSGRVDLVRRGNTVEATTQG